MKEVVLLERRRVHKDFGSVTRTKCCWKSAKADILLSVSHFLLSRGHVKSKEHGELSIYQIEAERFFCRMKIPQIIKFCDSSPWNELNHFHQKEKVSWFFFGSRIYACWSGQYFRTKDIGDFRQLRSVACREYTLHRDDPQLNNQKGGSEETLELDLFWKSRQAFSTSNSVSKFEFNPWKKTILSFGSKFRMGPFVMWTITSSITLKVLQVHTRRKQNEQAQKWLQPDQRQKWSLNQENLLARRPFHLMKEFGPKGWIRGNMRIGPVLEVTTSFSALQIWNWNSNWIRE